MNRETIEVGAFGANCVVLWEIPSEAVVVDPGAEPGAIEALLARHGLSVAAYWLTHGHIDHISALRELLASRPAPVVIHADDAEWAFSGANRFPPYIRVPARPESLVAWTPPRTNALSGTLAAGNFIEARVLHTPGHSPGSVCYYFEKDRLLLSGDTLFLNSVGRTDLPGGDSAALMQSLARIARLPDDTAVVPGHGPATTIGDERRSNPFFHALRNPRP